MKITVVGAGYVGLSNAVLLAQNHEVCILDIDSQKNAMINQKISPIIDRNIEEYLKQKDLNLWATEDTQEAYSRADMFIIAISVNYNPQNDSFDTSSLESVIESIINVNDSAIIVIKSTVPIGYTRRIQKKINNYKCVFLFSPEFLREGYALYDNLYPNRIVVGITCDDDKKRAMDYANLLAENSLNVEVPILIMDSTEAEAVKLFSNAYLAMRVAFFNELDTFAEINELNSRAIIEAIGIDPRIGTYYNNPSFGYGGYCLPKDTKQLLSNYKDIPNRIISSIIESNRIRKEFIVKRVLEKRPKVVGIYRLIMKSDSDNFRDSSILDIMEAIADSNVQVIIYEPLLKNTMFNNHFVFNNLELFKNESDVIIANRLDENILDSEKKLYTRDLFNKN